MPNKFRGNSFTPHQRRVLSRLLKVYDQVHAHIPDDKDIKEVAQVLREVIDSANPEADNGHHV